MKAIEMGNSYCAQFFQLIINLIPTCISLFDSKFWENLFNFLIQKISNVNEITEISIEGQDRDVTMIGFLQLSTSLIKNIPNLKSFPNVVKFLEDFFQLCVFNVATAENHGPASPPKFKTDETRKMAFNFLLEMCIDNEANYFTLRSLIERSHIKPLTSKWNYSPKDLRRGPKSYVGLKNMGCTCYMNSLIQQLVIFRLYFLLKKMNLKKKNLIPKYFKKKNISLQKYISTQKRYLHKKYNSIHKKISLQKKISKMIDYKNFFGQQFMIPRFRKGILAAPIRDTTTLLYHLQYSFASLQESSMKWHNPE